ncbi:unnamed protein product [Effrenium voratum]|nr:unnamed protein product [Effrenium voratum]
MVQAGSQYTELPANPEMFGRDQLALMCLGVCTLLPYNCLLNSQPYFEQHPFEGLDFPFTSMMTYSLCLCSSQLWLTCKGDSFSVNQRIGSAFIMQVVVCLSFFGITLAARGASGAHYYVPILLTIAVLALSNAVLQTGIFGVAGSISQEMSAAIMLGLGVSGLVSFFCSLLVQALQHAVNPEKSDTADAGMVVALVLWAICIAQTLSSCWVYFVYMRRRSPETSAAIAMLEEQRARPLEVSSSGSCESSEESRSAGAAQIFRRLVPILGEIWPQALNVCGVFLVTMSVFPGVLVHWEPLAGSSFVKARQVYGNLLIGCFQVGDVLGRSIAPPVGRVVGPPRLWILMLLRFAFIPLFMLGQRSPETGFWGSDAGRIVLCSIFAISNGLVANLAMMYGPECCSAVEHREVAGMAMSAIMVTGIFVGTLVAFATQIGLPAASEQTYLTTPYPPYPEPLVLL